MLTPGASLLLNESSLLCLLRSVLLRDFSLFPVDTGLMTLGVSVSGFCGLLLVDSAPSEMSESSKLLVLLLRRECIEFIDEFSPCLELLLLSRRVDITAAAAPAAGIFDILFGIGTAAS